MRISQAETQTHTLTLSIAPTRCQLEVAASRALRAEGRDPSEYQFAEPDEGLCSLAMSGQRVTVEVRHG